MKKKKALCISKLKIIFGKKNGLTFSNFETFGILGRNQSTDCPEFK